jgi:hypothetical protein
MTVNGRLSQIWTQMNTEILKYEIIIYRDVDFVVLTAVSDGKEGCLLACDVV